MTPVMGTTYYTMDNGQTPGYFNEEATDDVLKNYVKHQIEYYFSKENLQRDFFLRRKMTNDGYLPISLVASFNRVQQLTQDITFIVESVVTSDIVEVKDGLMIRPLDDPESWPLKPTDLNPNVAEFVPTKAAEKANSTRRRSKGGTCPGFQQLVRYKTNSKDSHTLLSQDGHF